MNHSDHSADSSAPACERCGGLFKTVTPRQVDVIERLAQGENMDEAAKSLNISRKTVEKHVQQAKVRLSAKTLAHLVAAAVRAQLITV